MLAHGARQTGPVLNPLVTGVLKAVTEAVPDEGGGGDPEAASGVLEPDPELYVLARAEGLIEPGLEQNAAAHERGTDAEPGPDPAVVMVPGKGGSPVAGPSGSLTSPNCKPSKPPAWNSSFSFARTPGAG